jgi:hypothetical protein
MRQALNSNPVVQIALIGVLAIAVGFLFMTRVMKSDESSSAPEPASPSAATPATSTDGSAADSSSAASESSAATPAPAASSSAGVPAAPGVAAAPVGSFEAGPGLPAAVVEAYSNNRPVVLLVTRRAGIEDKRLRAMVARARTIGNSAVFTTYARKIARYSRITTGVDVERVPALVVIRPQKMSQGSVPEAAVSYGFRGPQSLEQAVRDALYEGRDDLPYYPK